jgi:hypothetical protein
MRSTSSIGRLGAVERESGGCWDEDRRQEPAIVALVCSYSFSGGPVHLSDLYWRPDDITQQYWALPYVPRKGDVGKDVYVLTRQVSVSAANALDYHLKSRGRAGIVGEVTGGYAHPGRKVRIDAQFSVIVTQSRTINALTSTDWEGTGVKPDIEVPAAQALGTAHLRALEKALEREEDEGRKGPLNEAVEAARKGRVERKD